MPKPVLPIGFKLSAASAAIKKPGRPDMALIYSEAECALAASFTTNKVKGAPVKLDMEKARSGKGRAVIVNSGCANVCTGRQGLRDAKETADLIAKRLGISGQSVYVCSTGIIGAPLPMERIRPAITRLARTLGAATPLDVARAIMTTDTFPKVSMRRLKIGENTGTLLGMAKGAGMIAPKMATMFAFAITDIAVQRQALKEAFKEAVEASFNRLTVDGDMSTSDTAIVMANGMLGNKEITRGSKYYGPFKAALKGLTYELSRMIAKDGEGASKLIEVGVGGAKTQADAERAAFAIANSLLVKTAIYGADPNLGRIMAALGRSGAYVREEKTDIRIGDVKIVSAGVSTGKEVRARAVLKGKEIKITADLNSGRASASVLTCDLTEDYVKVNARYST